MNRATPARIVAAYLMLILSAAFPPAFLFTVPFFVITVVGPIRRAIFLRRSRDAFIQESQVQLIGKLFSSKQK